MWYATEGCDTSDRTIKVVQNKKILSKGAGNISASFYLLGLSIVGVNKWDGTLAVMSQIKQWLGLFGRGSGVIVPPAALIWPAVLTPTWVWGNF